MNIDFDYKINDPNKILFLVKNVFEGDPCPDQFLSCDCFDESECHHLSTHSNDSFDFNQNRMSTKCSFCQFYDYLNKNFTTLKTNMENTKSNSAKKHYINLRFKKRTYSPEILEWCNVFTWKSPFALVAFASCKTDDDIYRAIKNFQQEKEKFKKTLICSKLFIDVHKKHEMSEEFQKTIRKHGSKVEPNVPSHPNIELDSISTIDSSLLAQTSLENIPSSLSDNVSFVHQNVSLGLISDNLLDQNQKSPEPKQVQVSEAELKKLVQSMEKDIVYLDFIFARDIDDTYNALIETDKIAITNAISECADGILVNFAKIITDLSQNAEKRLNYFWNFVKTPIEKKNDEKEAPRGLSISVLNESDVLGRLKKIKGDYYFMMNHLEQAMNYFSQACEKIGDTLWYSSAYESLYSSSYLYEKNKTNSSVEPTANGSNKNGENKQKSLKKIAQLFKKTKDQSQILDSSNFSKNYIEILNHYLAKKETKIFGLEASMMITKYFMEKNMKNEALEILRQVIYISNVDLSEEEKIRRYLDISLVYDHFGMHHQAAFYQYISSGRVFRLIENDSTIIRSSYFKCLLRRCISILKGLFDIYKICETNKELSVDQVGFPEIKIKILLNVIKLYQYDSNVSESIKFIKYLIHEMSENLSDSSIQNYFETFMMLLKSEKNTEQIKNEPFYTKFFKFPIINSINPIVLNSELNKSAKISYQSAQSIYIHRYQSVQPSNRKPKKFTLPVDHLNKIEIFFTNPLPIEIKIKQLDLIAEEMDESKLLHIISLVNYENTNEHEIILEPNCTNIKLNLAFNFSSIGTFRVIGYKILVFNSEDMIYFNEISENNKNKYSISKCPSSIHNFFDLNMVPNLPLIKSVYLFEQNTHLSSPAYGLSESKTLVIDSYLGNSKIFLMDFLLEYQVPDMEILTLKLSILNEQILENLQSTVSLKKKEKVYLEIESHDYAFDTESKELELNTYLEIKYTNRVGVENNLCNLFKIQTTVKFTQAILAKVVDINDVDESEFELVLNIENLLPDKLIKCIFNDTQIEIESKSTSTLKIKIKKFNLESLFDSKKYNTSSLKKLNELMNVTFSIESKNEVFKVLLSDQGTNLKPFLSRIYKFPFALKSIVKMEANSLDQKTSSYNYCSLMLLAFNKPEFKCLHGEISLNANIRNKIKNFYATKNFTWIFDNLKSDYWCKEVKLIRTSQDTKLFEITFDFKSSNGQEILKWSYSFSVDNRLCYIPFK